MPPPDPEGADLCVPTPVGPGEDQGEAAGQHEVRLLQGEEPGGQIDRLAALRPPRRCRRRDEVRVGRRRRRGVDGPPAPAAEAGHAVGLPGRGIDVRNDLCPICRNGPRAVLRPLVGSAPVGGLIVEVEIHALPRQRAEIVRTDDGHRGRRRAAAHLAEVEHVERPGRVTRRKVQRRER